MFLYLASRYLRGLQRRPRNCSMTINNLSPSLKSTTKTSMWLVRDVNATPSAALTQLRRVIWQIFFYYCGQLGISACQTFLCVCVSEQLYCRTVVVISVMAHTVLHVQHRCRVLREVLSDCLYVEITQMATLTINKQALRFHPGKKTWAVRLIYVYICCFGP